MNAVLSSYGQLCGCLEILKKVVNFFVVGLTYGCLRSWKRISFRLFFVRTILKCWLTYPGFILFPILSLRTYSK